MLAVADCQEQRVGILGSLAGRAEGLDTGCRSQFKAGLGDVEAVDGQFGCQAGGHRQAHGSEAQDGNGVLR